jgi:protein SCO1/2
LNHVTSDSGIPPRVTQSEGWYYKKVEWPDRSDYTVDHSAFIYLMGRDGEYLGFFPPGTSAERLVEVIRPRLAANR